MKIVAGDSTDGGARDQCENVTVSENDQSGAQSRKNTALKLVKKIGAVHQGQGHSSDRIFREKCVDVFTDQIRPAQTHGLHGESLRFQPLGEQVYLGRTARTVGTFDNDQCSAEFFRLYTRQGSSVEARR